MIKIGDKLPDFKMKLVEHGIIKEKQISTLFDNKTVILFGIPGAFTPTCSNSHLPSFVEHFDKLKSKGVNHIVCLSINDAFVLSAWANATSSSDKIIFIADGSGILTKAMGVDLDLTAHDMGIRCTRFSMVVKNGLVSSLHVEDNPSVCSVSNALTIVEDL